MDSDKGSGVICHFFDILSYLFFLDNFDTWSSDLEVCCYLPDWHVSSITWDKRVKWEI